MPKSLCHVFSWGSPGAVAKNTLSTLALLISLTLLPACGGLNPVGGSKDAQLENARRLIEQGNYEEAFMRLNEALAEAPLDPNVHLNLGWLYLYTNDPVKTQKEITELERLSPNHAGTYHLRGALYRYQAQQVDDTSEESVEKLKETYELAVSNFMEALKRDRQNHQAYFDLATTLIELDRDEEALEALDKGFEHIPSNDLNTQVNFQIATCNAHAQMGLYEEAIADCEQALEFIQAPTAKQQVQELVNNMKLMGPDSQPPEDVLRFKPDGRLIDSSVQDAG